MRIKIADSKRSGVESRTSDKQKKPYKQLTKNGATVANGPYHSAEHSNVRQMVEALRVHEIPLLICEFDEIFIE